MENLYKLVNERIKNCEIERKYYESVVEECFICNMVPTIMEKVLNGIELDNYEAYKHFETIPVEEKIDIIETDDGNFNYGIKFGSKYLEINRRLFSYYRDVLSKFLDINEIGKFYSIKEYDKNYFIIKTTLGKLIEVYNRILAKASISFADDYVRKIDLITSSLSGIYDTEVVEIYYNSFLNSIFRLIKSEINKINVLNYQDFDINNRVVEYKYWVRLKDKGYGQLSTIDVVVPKNSLKAVVYLIKNFLYEYEVGVVGYDDAYTIEIKTSLAKLMDAYYMEVQRLSYINNKEEKPLVLGLK